MHVCMRAYLKNTKSCLCTGKYSTQAHLSAPTGLKFGLAGQVMQRFDRYEQLLRDLRENFGALALVGGQGSQCLLHQEAITSIG